MWGMAPFFSTDKTVAETNTLLKPFFSKVKSLGIDLAINTTYYDSFYPAYQATFGPNNYYVGGAGSTPGNRMLPTENWADAAIRNATFPAVQNAVEEALMLNVYHQHPNDDFNKG